MTATTSGGIGKVHKNDQAMLYQTTPDSGRHVIINCCPVHITGMASAAIAVRLALRPVVKWIALTAAGYHATKTAAHARLTTYRIGRISCPAHVARAAADAIAPITVTIRMGAHM